MPRGGARPGAGRKSKKELLERKGGLASPQKIAMRVMSPREVARARGGELMEMLVKVALDDGEDTRIRVRAAEIALSWGYVSPKEYREGPSAIEKNRPFIVNVIGVTPDGNGGMKYPEGYKPDEEKAIN